jgi:ParB-like chromosome segregation protein Spo0J
MNKLPALSDDERTRLSESIALDGVIVPVIKDQDGTIIDGHHRAAIAEGLGIDYPVTVLTVDEERRERLAITLNWARRQLSSYDGWAMIADLADRHAAAASEAARQRMGEGRPGRPGLGPTSTANQDIADRINQDLADAGETKRITGSVVKRAKRLMALHDEVKDQVKAGELSPYEAIGESSRKKAEWRSLPRSEWHYKQRHIKSERVLRETANMLEGLASGVRLIDAEAIEPGSFVWVDSMKQSLSLLNRFVKEITSVRPGQ